MTIPTTQLWCRVSELDAARQRIADLERQLAEAQQRPLIAVAHDDENASLRLENTKLRRRLDAVRELMKSRSVLD